MSEQIASGNDDVGPSGDVAAFAIVIAIIVGFFVGSVLAYWSASGYIGLQNHGDKDTVYFKEVSVKKLE